ncbi:hypothetical protein IFR04_006996 [Cadophora malorum]|uniref:Ankyrin n=1 Tax=Cadophora malorum TaxID=108018 RepID=A0A8H7WB59_9HELO|nr:hypothetical protein IFR04_006996 [Cadophora malorum]
MAGSGNRLPGSGSISSDFIAHTDSSTSTPSPPHAIANPALLFTGPRYNSTSQYISHYYGNIPTRGYHPTCTTDIIQHVDGLFMADSSLRKVVEKYPELLQKISQTIDNVVSWEFKQNPYMNRLDRANILFREITAADYHPLVVCAFKIPPLRVQNNTIELFLLQCRQELFAQIFSWVDTPHDTHHLLRRMLSWIHLSKRPLSARELQEAMRFSLSDCQPPLHTLHTFQELNFLGGGFIQFREATNEVTIPEGFRQSIGNYFGRYGGDYGGYHDRMCFVCLDYINRAIGFASPGTDAISLEHRLQLFPLLAYAVENWHYDVQPTTGYMKRAAAYLRDDEIIRIMMQIQRKIQFESQPDGVSSQELSQRHRWDTTRLNYAVSIGNYHLVEAFLSCGCNPNGEADHQPPLISAVMNRHSNIVRLLVGYGANVSIVDFANRTPLYLAVFQNDFATVQYLLSTRARGDLNHQMEMTDRMTPLMAAICNGNLQIAEILL